MKRIGAKKAPLSEKITMIVSLVLFLLIAAICIYPSLWAMNNSLKDWDDWTYSDTFALTSTWRFDNYYKVFLHFKTGDVGYFGMWFNSVWMLVVRVFVNISSSAMLAYAIARFRFPGKEFLYAVVIFVNTIPVIGSGPAAYKLMDALDMIDKPWKIWPSWAAGFDFAFIVLYGYFKGISPSYSESAYIDGANELTVFFRIILPQVVPCLVAIMVTQSIGVWNDYGTVQLYLRKYPNLAYGMFTIEENKNLIPNSMPIFFTATVVSSLPIIILYACTQKLILTNMTAGGLKG